MKSFQPFEDPRSTQKTNLTIGLLLLASLAIAFLVVRGGILGSAVLFAGSIGLLAIIAIVIYPITGFYLSLVIGFFFADIQRLLGTELPFGILLDLCVIFTFISLMINLRINRQKMLSRFNHPIVYIYLVIIAYSILQVFNPAGNSLAGNLLILRRFVALQLFLACAIIFFSDIKQISFFFRFWLVFATIAGIYGCFQEFFGYPQYELTYINNDPILVALYSSDTGGDFRKFSILTDPTSFGIAMAVSASIYLCLMMNLKQSLLTKLGILVSVAFMLLGMSFSGTRTATFALCMGVLLYILMTLSNWKTLVFAAIAIMGFVFVMFGPIEGNPTIDRLRTTFELSEDASLNVRDVNRKSIQPYLQSHPFGGGLGTTGGTAGEIRIDAGSAHPLAGFPSDSGFLKMGLEYGWIGLILQCLAFFIVLQQGVRAYFRSNVKKYRVYLLAATIGVFGYVISHYAQVSIGTVPGTFLFYSLFAVIIRLRQKEHPVQISN